MSKFYGTGPSGTGYMTGWGRGHCGAGMGRSPLPGYGRGHGFGWYAVGYGPDAAAPTPAAGYRSALEARKALLSAELARIEALLAGAGAESEPAGQPM